MGSDRGNAKVAGSFSVPGDADALFRDHAPWLLRVLRHRFGRDVADDLFQETYLRLARQTSPKPIASPKAYLLQVARNIFINGYRREQRRAVVEAAQFALPEVIEAANQLQAVVLREIVLGMPKTQRDVFLLNRAGGMTNAEIAEHFGISVKAVEARMTKALAYCAAQLRS